MSDQGAPLGVSFDSGVGTIRVYSGSAHQVWFVFLDDENPMQVTREIELQRGDYDIWSASDPEIKPGTKYALRAAGPDGPRDDFNQDLLLIDPYAKGIKRENQRTYYCVAIDDSFDWQGVAKPNVPLDRAIIYEAHARGLTRGNTALPDDIRGTYAALAHPSTIEHLKKIGITTVELLPIHQVISEPRLLNMGLFNYWGYNSINFFTPHHRYASLSAQAAGPQAILNELKTAVRELHRNGIEVILDVVYNHTAEGGNRGLTFSYRGLDAAGYYRQDDAGNYQDTTGCGNSLNFANSHVVDLVIDSMRYWTNELQIDGFRFDLAVTLARDESNSFNPNHPILHRIVDDPDFAQSKLIVEPWDVGLGGWQTGGFPDRFSEWNDRYRDSVRRFWLTDVANARNSGLHHEGISDIATRLAGSRDMVDGPSGPLGTVNFITAHDGFTLHDLVAYNLKHNQLNGESNRDGNSNNYSFNHGAEGEQVDDEIKTQRRKAARNLMATLLFSAGIPMITAGDERLKTQLGNNNAYCQDTVLSWMNWDLGQHQQDFEATTAHLIQLRADNAVLRPRHFSNFDAATPDSDLARWYNTDGELLTEEQWQNSETRTFSKLSARLEDDGTRNEVLMIVHGAETEQSVKLPEDANAAAYELVWDSQHETPTATTRINPGTVLEMAPASVKLLTIIR
ncbi:MAG: glycogen debranching protein GlgX [Micrococcales bacterium]